MGRHPNFKDLTGKRFTRLVVLREVDKGGRGNILWLCVCDCGGKTIIPGWGLLGQKTKSCGCLRKEVSRLRATTHGKSKTTEYSAWLSMHRRCYLTSCDGYKYWGGRGIRVCHHWHRDNPKGFENFFADMGKRPKGKTLDRKNNDGNYTPRNCKWSTQKEQVANSRRLLRRNKHDK